MSGDGFIVFGWWHVHVRTDSNSPSSRPLSFGIRPEKDTMQPHQRLSVTPVPRRCWAELRGTRHAWPKSLRHFRQNAPSSGRHRQIDHLQQRQRYHQQERQQPFGRAIGSCYSRYLVLAVAGRQAAGLLAIASLGMDWQRCCDTLNDCSSFYGCRVQSSQQHNHSKQILAVRLTKLDEDE